LDILEEVFHQHGSTTEEVHNQRPEIIRVMCEEIYQKIDQKVRALNGEGSYHPEVIYQEHTQRKGG
jgi:hypothetical protein